MAGNTASFVPFALMDYARPTRDFFHVWPHLCWPPLSASASLCLLADSSLNIILCVHACLEAQIHLACHLDFYCISRLGCVEVPEGPCWFSVPSSLSSHCFMSGSSTAMPGSKGITQLANVYLVPSMCRPGAERGGYTSWN